MKSRGKKQGVVFVFGLSIIPGCSYPKCSNHCPHQQQKRKFTIHTEGNNTKSKMQILALITASLTRAQPFQMM
jgi:Rtr1/RPAP2 family.